MSSWPRGRRSSSYSALRAHPALTIVSLGALAGLCEEALYRGPLFDEPAALDLFEAERERYRGQAYRLALWQGEFLAGLGDFSRAEESWTRATKIMPGDPDAALALIRSLAGRGRVEKAVQAYWDHHKTLKARAGLMPDAGFEAAYREALEG